MKSLPTVTNSRTTNEKYKGDELLQKGFTVDFLTKKQKKNEGKVPQYYIEDDHEAIIEPVVFDMVQMELERRCSGSRLMHEQTRYIFETRTIDGVTHTEEYIKHLHQLLKNGLPVDDEDDVLTGDYKKYPNEERRCSAYEKYIC